MEDPGQFAPGPDMPDGDVPSRASIAARGNGPVVAIAPVGGVVVNMLIDKANVADDAPEFVKNRVSMQADYMDEIWQTFDGGVRAIIPLFENEVRGVEMLQRTAGKLFA